MNDQIRQEAQRLLAAMTRDEKIDLIHGVDGMWTRGVPRLGVRKLHMADASMGLRDDAIPATAFPAFLGLVLEPGQEQETTVTLDRRAFAFFDVARQEWVVEPGEFRIVVGASSRDIRVEGKVTMQSDMSDKQQQESSP